MYIRPDVSIIEAQWVMRTGDGYMVVEVCVVDVGMGTTATGTQRTRVGREPGITIVAPLMVIASA
jgi:hypothetical protein